MNYSLSSQGATIARQLATAFAGVPKPHSVDLSTISNEDADEIIKHIFRYTDDVKNFYIPKILALALFADVDTSRRNEWIRGLVDLLDVDFAEHPAGIDALLKDVRRQTFSSYSPLQARAIYHWLEFLRANHDCSAFEKEIDSAVDYWRNRSSP